MDERATWRVGFFVEVEVESYHTSEAALVAEAACGWPGDWRPPLPSVTVRGDLDGHQVEARILRSRALMVKEV